jgi:hypothetical protein
VGFTAAPEVRSITAGSTVVARNSAGSVSIDLDGTEVFKSATAVSAVSHVDGLIVIGCVDGEEFSVRTLWRTDTGIWDDRGSRILLPEVVRKLSLGSDGSLTFTVGGNSVCVWRFVDGDLEAIYEDIQIAGIAKHEMIENVRFSEGVLSLLLKTGKLIRYNPRIHRWVADQ